MLHPRTTALTCAAAVAGAWLLYGVTTLHEHGATLDESSIFYAGDRTLFFLTHPFSPRALDLTGPGEPPGFASRFQRFPDFADTWHYPVFPGVLMALTSALFHDALGWVGDIDGHHLGALALHAGGLFAFTFYACRLLGTVAGLSAALVYAMYPSIVGLAFNDPKDLPATDFYGATLLAAACAFQRGRPRDLWAAALLDGIALSAKLNGAFAAVTLALWVLASRIPVARLRSAGLWRPFVLLPFVAFGVFFLLWPWLWHGTPVDWVERTVEYVRFYLNFAHSDRPTWTGFAFIAMGSMSPPLVLALGALGLAAVFSRASQLRPLRWLFVLWLALPLVRISLPHSEFYDANRHFLEYIGGLAVLAGVGAGVAWSTLRLLPLGRGLAAIAALAGVGLLWLPLAEYRPYENAYFNDFVGGLGGAQKQALFFMLAPPHDSRESGAEGDFWNSSLRNAMRTLDHIVPPGTAVGFCGPSGVNVGMNLEGPPPYRFGMWADPRTPYLYLMNRECYCKGSDIRRLEEHRPVLYRASRGGGLIDEILGPPVDYELPAITPKSRYADLPHYRGRLARQRVRRR